MDLISKENQNMFYNYINSKITYLKTINNQKSTQIISELETIIELLKSNKSNEIFDFPLKTELASQYVKNFKTSNPQKIENDISATIIEIINRLNPDSENLQNLLQIQSLFSKKHELVERKKSQENFHNLSYDMCITKLDSIFKYLNPKQLSDEEYLEICDKFQNLSHQFAKSIFQEYFSKQNKKITDLSISEDNSENKYLMNFNLEDIKNNSSSSQIISLRNLKKLDVLDYYQALCYSYLEAQNVVDSQNTNNISNKIELFKICKDKFKQIMDLNISNITKDGKIICSITSSINPQDMELEENINRR